MSVNVIGFYNMKPPITEALQRQRAHTMKGVPAWWSEVIMTRKIGDKIIWKNGDNKKSKKKMSKQYAYDNYKIWTKEFKKFTEREPMFWKQLKEGVGTTASWERISSSSAWISIPCWVSYSQCKRKSNRENST